ASDSTCTSCDQSSCMLERPTSESPYSECQNPAQIYRRVTTVSTSVCVCVSVLVCVWLGVAVCCGVCVCVCVCVQVCVCVHSPVSSRMSGDVRPVQESQWARLLQT